MRNFCSFAVAVKHHLRGKIISLCRFHMALTERSRWNRRLL
jgi:hypothetical protein